MSYVLVIIISIITIIIITNIIIIIIIIVSLLVILSWEGILHPEGVFFLFRLMNSFQTTLTPNPENL